MKKNHLLFVLCILSLSAAAQNTGRIDSTFNNNGMVIADFGFHDNLSAVKVQPDQSIVAVGVSINASYMGELKVLRLLPDGAFDPGFGTDGVVTLLLNLESYAYDCYVREDGKILVAGITSTTLGYFDMLLVRLNPDGSTDTSFGTDGVATLNLSAGDDIASAMAVQADGKILLSGTVADIDNRNVPTVARFTEDGQLDTDFGVDGIAQIPITGIDNELTSILVQPDGKIAASGHYDQSFGNFDFDVLLIRFNADGTPDDNFGTNGVVRTGIDGGVDDCFGMARTTAGKIVLAGFTVRPDQTYDVLLLQYDDTGALDPTFGTGGIVLFDIDGFDVALDVKLQPDQKILVAGTSGGADLFADRGFLLARFNPDGALDNSFANDGFTISQIGGSFDDANAVDLQADGKIILAGKANFGKNDMVVTRYINNLSTATAGPSFSENIVVSPNPVSRNESITITGDYTFPEKTQAVFYNASGIQVLSLDHALKATGNYSYEMKIPGTLAPGIYAVKLQSTGNKESVIRLVITD